MLRLLAAVILLSGIALTSTARADEAEDKAAAYVKKIGWQSNPRLQASREAGGRRVPAESEGDGRGFEGTGAA